MNTKSNCSSVLCIFISPSDLCGASGFGDWHMFILKGQFPLSWHFKCFQLSLSCFYIASFHIKVSLSPLWQKVRSISSLIAQGRILLSTLTVLYVMVVTSHILLICTCQLKIHHRQGFQMPTGITLCIWVDERDKTSCDNICVTE